MRYAKGHKETTRRRILDRAAVRLRRDGLGGVGVLDLMQELGLTQGGFYNHFTSKDDLVVAALSTALDASHAALTQAADTGGLRGLVTYYLSAAHRDAAATGCVAAALAGDLARGPQALRDVFTANAERTLALIRTLLPDPVPPARRRRAALSIYTSLVGSLALARAVATPALSDALLAAGRHAALALADTAHQRP